MKKFLKQLFCSHIWQEVEIIKLRTEEYTPIVNFSWLKKAYYQYNAILNKCIKCKKEKWTENKEFKIDHYY